jgi:hypothetical protein
VDTSKLDNRVSAGTGDWGALGSHLKIQETLWRYVEEKGVDEFVMPGGFVSRFAGLVLRNCQRNRTERNLCRCGLSL